MPSLSSTCFRYSTARVSLPGGLLVSIRTSAWKCCSVSASTAFQSIGACASGAPDRPAISRVATISIRFMDGILSPRGIGVATSAVEAAMANDEQEDMTVVLIPASETEAEHRRIRSSNDCDQRARTRRQGCAAQSGLRRGGRRRRPHPAHRARRRRRLNAQDIRVNRFSPRAESGP